MVLFDFCLEEKQHNTGDDSSSPYTNIGFRSHVSFFYGPELSRL